MATPKKTPAPDKPARGRPTRGRPPRNPEGGQYVNILFDTATLDAVEDFRYANRIPSRTEALRILLAFALEKKRPRSGAD